MNPFEWRCEQKIDCICGNDCDLEELRERREEDDYGGDNCTYGEDTA